MKSNTQVPKLAVCIQSDDPDLLTPRMIYEVLPNDGGAQSGYVRVIDNEGEDYLYPANYFIFVELPSEVQRALVNAPRPHLKPLSA